MLSYQTLNRIQLCLIGRKLSATNFYRHEVWFSIYQLPSQLKLQGQRLPLFYGPISSNIVSVTVGTHPKFIFQFEIAENMSCYLRSHCCRTKYYL
jgi:hypothetical protein